MIRVVDNIKILEIVSCCHQRLMFMPDIASIWQFAPFLKFFCLFAVHHQDNLTPIKIVFINISIFPIVPSTVQVVKTCTFSFGDFISVFTPNKCFSNFCHQQMPGFVTDLVVIQVLTPDHNYTS